MGSLIQNRIVTLAFHSTTVSDRTRSAREGIYTMNAATNRFGKCVLALLALAALASAHAQLSVSYDRSPVAPMTWFSAANGDLSGRWVTALVKGMDSPELFHGEFYWMFIGDSPDTSFIAYLKGTHNHRTDEIVFDGFIVDGYMEGARVEDRGTMANYDAKRVTGTIQIFPQGADAGDGQAKIVAATY